MERASTVKREQLWESVEYQVVWWPAKRISGQTRKLVETGLWERLVDALHEQIGGRMERIFWMSLPAHLWAILDGDEFR